MDWNAQFAAWQNTVEAALQQYADRWPAYGDLQAAMAYSLLSGGKRIRPVITLAVCRLFGGEEEQALPLACGLEMVHTYSLIHDDLPCMDDDDFRRGRPTFETLTAAPLPAPDLVRAVRCLSRAAGPAGMVGGQVLDLLGEGKTLSEEAITDVQRLKTGCMIQAAARLGAIAAGSAPEQEEAAADYARHLGLAFQIRDDLLDVLGDEATFGKPIGSDAANEKSTFITLLGVDACQRKVEELTERAVACLAPYAGRDFLCTLARNLAVRKK